MSVARKNPDWLIGFQEMLVKLADPTDPDRGALAHLRRGLDNRLYPLVRVGWLFTKVPDHLVKAAVLTAGLFAWGRGQCGHSPGVNFGTAFRAGLNEKEAKPREKRFVDIVETDAEDLDKKLRYAVSLMSRDGTGLDWELLFKDIVIWGHDDRRVQTSWSRGFWRIPAGTVEKITPPAQS